ncbi:MAG: hypothetical protein NVSMB56_13810 [Pyrinomonadaceae bacterium]
MNFNFTSSPRFQKILTRTIVVSTLLFFAVTAPAQHKKDERGIALKPGSTIAQLPVGNKRFALVIGVDNYADTQITTLGGAANDARSLANALVAYAGFPFDQVILLASDQPASRQPTRGNILRRLSNLAAVVPKDGLLLVFFAGHGIDRQGQAFLLPSDAQVSNDVNLLEQTAVNVTNIKDWIRKTEVRQIVLFIDACRNDPAGRADAPNPLTKTYTRSFNFDVRNKEVQAFATIYATQVGSRAYEYKEKHQGYFTWALVEGLKGAAANEKGEVTLDELVRYLQNRVPRQVSIDLGQGKEQKPFAMIEGYKASELVIAITKGAKMPPEVFKSETNVASVDAQARSGNPASPCDCQCPCPCAACPPPTIPAGIEGTAWTGLNESGEYIIEFLKGGKLTYSTKGIQNGQPHTFISPGNWKQSGKILVFTVNSFTTWTGKFEDGAIRGTASNIEGTEFKFLLTPKN